MENFVDVFELERKFLIEYGLITGPKESNVTTAASQSPHLTEKDNETVKVKVAKQNTSTSATNSLESESLNYGQAKHRNKQVQLTGSKNVQKMNENVTSSMEKTTEQALPIISILEQTANILISSSLTFSENQNQTNSDQDNPASDNLEQSNLPHHIPELQKKVDENANMHKNEQLIIPMHSGDESKQDNNEKKAPQRYRSLRERVTFKKRTRSETVFKA